MSSRRSRAREGCKPDVYGGTLELADLERSFLVRNGQRVPVDFERLFERGDLSQNIPLQPDDYLYFALASANEIYVLGEVMMPGVEVFLPRPAPRSSPSLVASLRRPTRVACWWCAAH